MLTAEQIRSADRESRSRVKAVEVPEWGGTVYVRRMSANDRDALNAEIKAGNPTRGWLAAACLCDEKGNALFHVTQADEVGAMDGQAIDRVNDAIMEFNGLTEKAVKETEKNSETTPNA